MGRQRRWIPLALLQFGGPLTFSLLAQTSSNEIAGQELLRRQEREWASRAQQKVGPDVRLSTAAIDQSARLPESETPCFDIREILLKSEAPVFDRVLSAANSPDDIATGRGLGSASIDLVMQRGQSSATVSSDDLLTLNDLSCVSANHNLGGDDKGKCGTRTHTVRYLIFLPDTTPSAFTESSKTAVVFPSKNTSN